jgi:hypothetical protein
MTEFEEVLQECLRDLEQGTASVDDCLSRHPQYAPELEPLLFTSTRLTRAGEMHVSDAFRARVRTRLVREMHAYPRQPARSGMPFLRLAVGFAVVLLALLGTGTAYAQGSLPGEPFYAWKLASEDAWRAVSSDPVETDLRIAERRVSELTAVSADPGLRAQTLEAYLETVARLRSQGSPEDQIRILRTLDSQAAILKKLGIFNSQSNPATPPPLEPTAFPTPSATPLPLLPTVQTPHVLPTDLPPVLPTDEDPPDILPTVDIPPELVPTIEVPPPIR